jgi:hypothetical protein
MSRNAFEAARVAFASQGVAVTRCRHRVGTSGSVPASRRQEPPPSQIEQILESPVARTVAGQLTRGLLGALLGGTSKRSRW